MKIVCPFCNEKIDLDDCEVSKIWETDEVGVDNHILCYRCPECNGWIDEYEISK